MLGSVCGLNQRNSVSNSKGDSSHSVDSNPVPNDPSQTQDCSESSLPTNPDKRADPTTDALSRTNRTGSLEYVRLNPDFKSDYERESDNDRDNHDSESVEGQK